MKVVSNVILKELLGVQITRPEQKSLIGGGDPGATINCDGNGYGKCYLPFDDKSGCRATGNMSDYCYYG